MQFKPIEIHDKPLLDKMFQRRQYENSWFNFTNLFIWRNTYEPEWAMSGETLFVFLTHDDATYALPPFVADDSDFSRAVDAIEAELIARGLPFLITGCSETMKQMLEAARPDSLDFKPMPDRFDYLYNAADLRDLAGRKYHAKRNYVNRFQNENPGWQYAELDESLMARCRDSAIEWCNRRDCQLYLELTREHEAIIEAFDHFSSLGLVGGAILIGDTVQAFSFGEMLNDDTALIHIEKANAEIAGLYQMINREFCQHAWQNAAYINREEDLGNEGLRKAKESYYPVRLIEKYEIRRR